MNQDEPPLTLRSYLLPVRRRWWLPIVLVLVCAVGAYLYGSGRPKTYTATTKLYFGQQGTAVLSILGKEGAPAVALADQATFITSSTQAAKVAKALGLSAGAVGGVSATPDGQTDFINIAARAGSAQLAVRLANAYAQQYISTSSAQEQTQAQKSISTLRGQLAQTPKGAAGAPMRQQIEQQLSQLQVIQQTGFADVTQVDPAHSASVHSTSPVVYAGLPALAGLVGSILLCFLLYRLDPRINSVDDAESSYPYPVLATVPHDPDIHHKVDGAASLPPRALEAFRDLRVAIELDRPESAFGMIAVCSSSPGEGKTTVARNLALAFAEMGRRVALVDGDLRRSQLAASFSVDYTPGLTDLVAAAAPLDAAKRSVPTVTAPLEGQSLNAAGSGGLFESADIVLVPGGTVPPNPLAVTESAALAERLAQLRAEFDLVIIDTAPLTAVSDAIPFLRMADAVLIVARSGTSDRRSVRKATQMLHRMPDAYVVGIVVNDVSRLEAYGYGPAGSYGAPREGAASAAE